MQSPDNLDTPLFKGSSLLADHSRSMTTCSGWFLLVALLFLPLCQAQTNVFGERESPTSPIPASHSLAPTPVPPAAATPSGGKIPMQNVPMVKANQPQTTNPSLQTTLTVPVNAVPLIESTIKTYQNDQPEIDLIMRLPEGHTKEHPTAKGVLAFCTWQRSKEALRATLQSETNPLVQYAMRNHLALLTWNTAILWKTLKKGERVDLFKNAQLERAFDSVATSWRVGVEQLCKEQNIPATGVLLDGFSAGAHWSERLALRHPSMFLAVHLHVANNYEQISDNAVGPLWAVSSGDLDVGRNSTVNFYRECQSRGFPIILKVSNGLGHASNSEIEKFRDAFFDYALDVAKRPGRKSPASMMLEDLNSANLVGDFLSQEVYHNSSVSQVPVSQRVPLPDVQVAKAWGYLRK